MMESLHEVQISSLERIQQGKVRDMFRIDDEHMLIVTSDRISAFDVVLPDPIPGKGAVLTAVSNFWFQRMSDLIPNHMTELTLEEVVPNPAERELIAGRAVIVRRYQPLPVEAIVRGYLIGSGWKDYQRDGAVSGVQLPSGLQQADQLPETIFTPSTKADVGDHDENINFEQMVDLLDRDLGEQVRDISIEIYTRAAAFAKQRGIIIADTKFEFGLDDNGKLFLIDEVLTPDSSRFWPVDSYKPGISPPSFDKQFVRDYLETLDDWDKMPPGPKLPTEIIEKTAAKYREAQQRITET